MNKMENKMIKIFFWILLLSISILAQTSQVTWFETYQVEMINNSTNEITKRTTKYEIKLTENELVVYGETSKIIWRFKKHTFSSTATSFFSMANDKNGGTCKIWFKTYDDAKYAFGVEYTDLSFLYLCTIRK